jgi:hypothetical protein
VPAVELSVSEWLSIITHVKKWVTNLLRAKADRKKESKEALRAVIMAVRETTLYVRNIRESGEKSIEKERELSLLWTDLSFRLKDLGLRKLAKRCNIKGRYWADPTLFDAEALDVAGIRLSDIERLAISNIDELEN